jgi:hypothetical protein
MGKVVPFPNPRPAPAPEAPPFDPRNPDHQRAWATMWRLAWRELNRVGGR